MGRLDNKVALITGGARGMGATHAKLFIEEGAKVVITDVLVEDGMKTADELGDNCVFFKHDVTNEADWENVVKKTEETFGPITVLINNAGVARGAGIEEITTEEFEFTYRVNQLGAFLGIKKTLDSLKKSVNSSIINISSLAGMVGQADSFAYTATKFALRGMTKAAALDLGVYGIRVNSVHPGIINTPMTAADEYKEYMEQVTKKIPLNRTAEDLEVSKLCLYLASDDSSYSTGAEFIVDGGFTAQ